MHRTTITIAFGAAALHAAVMGCGGEVADVSDSAPVDTLRDSGDDVATVIIDAHSEAAIACSSGYDCSSLFFSQPSSQSSVPCCTDGVCRLEPYDDCSDANAQLIQASNYDQSCAADTDCVAVAEGNFCYPGAGNCPNAAISKSANAQYQADTAKTRAASCPAPGGCVDESGPCCVGGKCQVGGQCASALLTCALGAACSETQVCPGGIAGCSSNCQCLNGAWQAPCPAYLPQTGDECAAPGAYCGYSDVANGCGADNCYCQGGAWACEPTCIIPDDAATDSGPADADVE
jgi:hypothetical protein